MRSEKSPRKKSIEIIEGSHVRGVGADTCEGLNQRTPPRDHSSTAQPKKTASLYRKAHLRSDPRFSHSIRSIALLSLSLSFRGPIKRCLVSDDLYDARFLLLSALRPIFLFRQLLDPFPHLFSGDLTPLAPNFG